MNAVPPRVIPRAEGREKMQSIERSEGFYAFCIFSLKPKQKSLAAPRVPSLFGRSLNSVADITQADIWKGTNAAGVSRVHRQPLLLNRSVFILLTFLRIWFIVGSTFGIQDLVLACGPKTQAGGRVLGTSLKQNNHNPFSYFFNKKLMVLQ